MYGWASIVLMSMLPKANGRIVGRDQFVIWLVRNR